MKIAFVVTRSDTIGGSHIHVRDLSKALTADGHDVRVAIGGDGPILDHFRSHGVEIVPFQSLRRDLAPLHDLKALQELTNWLKRFKPDIVSTHSSKAGFHGRVAARRAGIPVLFTAHGWSFTDGKQRASQLLYQSLEKIILPATDRLIAVSEYDRKLAIERLKADPERVVTIYNGMPDLEHSSVPFEKDPQRMQIVMVARFDYQKDHETLLRAVSGLRGIHLHLVGDGSLMSRTRKLAQELNLEEQITWWGRLDDVSAVLERSDLFILISHWEGFPRSTLEAMRSGLPVVLSDTGGAAEAVAEEETGFVIPSGDQAALREKIEWFVKHPEARVEMGKKSKQRFREKYTFRQMYEKTMMIYQEVIEQKNPTRKRG